MDIDLPFYYWTLNERFSDDVYPSFDERPEIDEEVDARNHPSINAKIVDICCRQSSSSSSSQANN